MYKWEIVCETGSRQVGTCLVIRDTHPSQLASWSQKGKQHFSPFPVCKPLLTLLIKEQETSNTYTTSTSSYLDPPSCNHGHTVLSKQLRTSREALSTSQETHMYPETTLPGVSIPRITVSLYHILILWLSFKNSKLSSQDKCLPPPLLLES